ncbi:MAG: NAD(P)/FAD-dependent oxidoreductase, partial [Hyphomicrobiales bacterium]
LDCEIVGGAFGGGKWTLKTSRGTLTCSHVINCAGLFGDLLDVALLGSARFEIRPRKGQIVVFDKAAAKLVNAIILPVPTSQTKGVVVTRTVFGNVLVGPTAQNQDSRTDTSTDEATLRGLLDLAALRIPALAQMPVTAAYAGLRPATGRKDYRIEATPEQNWITVGGIRSTGLSAALGIAAHVYRLYGDMGARHRPIDRPIIPRMPVLTAQGARDWALAGHGEMVCHCELVTERDVQKALTGPLAAHSLAGLKRQTRVTMGHCQGFYCSARIAELTDDLFDAPISVGTVHD